MENFIDEKKLFTKNKTIKPAFKVPIYNQTPKRGDLVDEMNLIGSTYQEKGHFKRKKEENSKHKRLREDDKMKDIMAQIGETIGIKNNHKREHSPKRGDLVDERNLIGSIYQGKGRFKRKKEENSKHKRLREDDKMKDIMAQIGETIGIKNNYRREHTKTQNIFYKDMSKININNKLKKNNEIKEEDRLTDEIECYLIDQHNFKEEVKENICLNSEIHSNISSRLLKNNENILFSDNVEDKYYKSKYNSPNTGKYDNNKRFISDIKHKNVTQNNPILNTHSIKRKFKEDNDLDIIMMQVGETIKKSKQESKNNKVEFCSIKPFNGKPVKKPGPRRKPDLSSLEIQKLEYTFKIRKLKVIQSNIRLVAKELNLSAARCLEYFTNQQKIQSYIYVKKMEQNIQEIIEIRRNISNIL